MKGLREIMRETIVKGGTWELDFSTNAYSEGYTYSAINGFLILYIQDIHNKYVLLQSKLKNVDYSKEKLSDIQKLIIEETSRCTPKSSQLPGAP